jgi:hypothetical protein
MEPKLMLSKTVLCVPSISRALVLSLKSIHSLMRLSQSKKWQFFFNCFIRLFCNFEKPIQTPFFLFPSFTIHSYGLPLETIRSDFKSGLEGLLKEKPTKAIFIGTRIGDPNAVVPMFHCSVKTCIPIVLQYIRPLAFTFHYIF